MASLIASYAFFLLFAFAHPQHLQLPKMGNPTQIGEECKTPEPNVRPGKCIHVRDCAELLSLFGGQNRNVEYVRQSICSMDNGDPRVCCPVETTNKLKLFPDPLNYECGLQFSNRIIGGENAPLSAWPWMALLFYQIPGVGVLPRCAGAVINKRYVITAAHCVSSESMGDSKLAFVRLGEHTLSTNPDCEGPSIRDCASPAIDANVEEIISHPNFRHNSTTGARFDIALIRLANDIDFEAGSIVPVCLPFNESIIAPDGDISFDNKTGWVTGWGLTTIFRPNNGSDVLQQLKVPIVPLAICSTISIYKTVELNEEHICAGGEPEKDTCIGDSGGPLVIPRPYPGLQQFFIVGVVSFGTPLCGSVRTPGVYSRVTHYLNWILDQVHE